MSDIEAKIVKQIEYYFGDLNLAKDKHLKQLISNSSDGWVSYEEMLKFPRLKMITDDKNVIKMAINNSESKLVEANESGIRRYSELEIPSDLQALTEMHIDKSVYVKGFKGDETIDEVIEYLEKYGGPTLNVHMRRLPKSKNFKGSVFAIFKLKEDAEKLLNNEEAVKFKEMELTRMWQSDYNKSKKNEFDEKRKEKEQRQKTALATREALLETKMTKGALIQLSGFDFPIENNSEKVTGDFTDNRDTRSATKNLKTWLTELLKDVAPVSWVEYFPSTGKVIVRFGKENVAEEALKKLSDAEDGSFKYQIYNLSGVTLTGEIEKDYWRNILNEQNRKVKRGGRGGGGPDRKKMRR